MENETFAHLEQMLHFPEHFQKYSKTFLHVISLPDVFNVV